MMLTPVPASLLLSDHGSEHLLSSTRTGPRPDDIPHGLDIEPQVKEDTRFNRHLVTDENSIKGGEGTATALTRA